MKLEQKPMFQPIVITLETAEEAEMFWEIIRFTSPPAELSSKALRYAIMVSNWFSDQAQLGGEGKSA